MRTNQFFILFFLWALPLSAQELRIFHIDVEQASSTLFVAPGGKTLLVDSGKNGMGQRIKTVMDRANVAAIDFFVDTHYHEDHYGGIDDLANLGVPIREAYDRGGKNLLPSSKLNEVTYQDYQAAVGNRALQLSRGMTLPVDPLMTVTCISSGGAVIGEDPPVINNDENNLSISLLITFGSFRYFIGGDIQAPTEQKIADRDLVRDVDVYISDHHGSDTSSIQPFIQDLAPRVIIVSNGDNAGFHHPRQLTLTAYSQLPGPPTVFQTNKCTKGPPCGNAADEFIADPQSVDQDGTIALTADIASHSYTVAFDSGASRTFPFRMSPSRSTTRDFDGDSRTELSIFRPSTGEWFIRYSSLDYSVAGYGLVQWGLPGDIPLAGDFDGDGKTEITVFRPSTGEWYIRYSSLGYSLAGYAVYQWGLPGDTPLAGDFDGDGKTEITVFRPSTGEWYIRYSSLGYGVAGYGVYQWGLPGDVPLSADFDGDGKTELTVFRPSIGSWNIRYSSLGYSLSSPGLAQWGLPGDVPLAGDFDGDGKTELTVYRPSTGEWYIWYSPLGYSLTGYAVYQWGLPDDTPMTADFDGDGKAEISVYRPSTGDWYIRYSSLGYSLAGYAIYQWGLPGDALVK